MADEIRATPQNQLLGLLSSGLSSFHQGISNPFGYQNPPAEKISNFIGVPALQRTIERMSYGEPLTTGQGMTTQVRPDTLDAALAIAPLAPIAGRAGKGIARMAGQEITDVMSGLPARSTSSIQALELAQQRAALPVEQGGLGLPKNNTPEMRANAMGFDINLFHGTRGDFLLFDPFNPIFATEVADIANLYAGKGLGANVMPLKFRGKELTVSDLNQDGKSGYFAENLAKKLGLHKEGDKLNLSDIRERELINELSKYGIDRIKITNMGDMGGSQTQYVLPARSDNVRSRFAAFDPFRKDVATATAMGVALPDLLAQPLSPMYTDPFGNTIGESIR
jgi:hypothetical protein